MTNARVILVSPHCLQVAYDPLTLEVITHKPYDTVTDADVSKAAGTRGAARFSARLFRAAVGAKAGTTAHALADSLRNLKVKRSYGSATTCHERRHATSGGFSKNSTESRA